MTTTAAAASSNNNNKQYSKHLYHKTQDINIYVNKMEDKMAVKTGSKISSSYTINIYHNGD